MSTANWVLLRRLQGQIVVKGTVVLPSPTAKLLGVVFDQELRSKEHVHPAIKRVTKTIIALCGLRHLRPEQMRQLYQHASHRSYTTHGPCGTTR